MLYLIVSSTVTSLAAGTRTSSLRNQRHRPESWTDYTSQWPLSEVSAMFCERLWAEICEDMPEYAL